MFRPYHDEALTSWLSRAASVYGCTFLDLLSAHATYRPGFFEDIDLNLSPLGLIVIQGLVGGPMEQIKGCTLATAYPHWLPEWISCPAPLWHVTERRTVGVRTGLRPAVCSVCLSEDTESGRSQHLRLSWYSSVTTVCPIHLVPLVTCCASFSPDNLSHENSWSRNKLIHCRSCNTCFHRSRGSSTKTGPLVAVARIEALLRGVLSGDPIVNLGDRLVGSKEFLLFIEDTVWALMTLIPGTQYRLLHALATRQFPVPMGFNTPVNVDNWLCCSPLIVRRSLLAVVASLVLPKSLTHHLKSQHGCEGDFWKAMNSLHSTDDRAAFENRHARWCATILEAVHFH